MKNVELVRAGKTWVLVVKGHRNLEFRSRPSKEAIRSRLQSEFGIKLEPGELLNVKVR